MMISNPKNHIKINRNLTQQFETNAPILSNYKMSPNIKNMVKAYEPISTMYKEKFITKISQFTYK